MGVFNHNFSIKLLKIQSDINGCRTIFLITYLTLEEIIKVYDSLRLFSNGIFFEWYEIFSHETNIITFR